MLDEGNSNDGTLQWEGIVKRAVHDMRGPLSSLRTAMEVLRLTIPPSEKSDRLLVMINKQLDLLTGQMATLVDDPAAFKQSND